ncbi:hypothetical protein [Helicobacter acinonychis]|uniref:hypothetical protein n=1 Tax=Helicobacter acinonychis TaxID=212 RepID=UPI0005A13BCE|nr:hypothetical protein [Helicobacter acinonychis]STP04028.1 Uncharacterised protein [Helicobacter acinonychis]
MLENIQNIPLQSFHEVGVSAAESETFIRSVVSLATNIYERFANGKDPKGLHKDITKRAMLNLSKKFVSLGLEKMVEKIPIKSPKPWQGISTCDNCGCLYGKCHGFNSLFFWKD